MNITEKKIISKIDFTETELQFLKDLSNTITICCENNPNSCETCPFCGIVDGCGASCNEVSNFLDMIARYKKAGSIYD